MISLADALKNGKGSGMRMPKSREESFECPRHGRQDYITFVNHDGTWKDPYCPACLKEERRAAERLEDLREQARRASVEATRSLGIAQPHDMGRARFDTYHTETAAQSRVVAVCRRFAERFLIRETQRRDAKESGAEDWREKNSTGLFLAGNFGTGKTHLAYAILNELERLGTPGYYLRIPDFIDRVNDRSSGINLLQVMGALYDVPCLVLDELGVQSWTEAERKRIYQVVDGRMQAGRPTVYVTNLDRKELERCLSARVVDRIDATTVPLVFTWESHRKQTRPRAENF